MIINTDFRVDTYRFEVGAALSLLNILFIVHKWSTIKICSNQRPDCFFVQNRRAWHEYIVNAMKG